MAISTELFSAILAMDSYNRGYNAGVDIGPDDSAIGLATIDTLLTGADLAAAKSHGFYAVAYD